MSRKISLFLGLLAMAGAAAWAWHVHAGLNGATPVVYGNVDIREVSLAFRTPGRVLQVLVDEGDVVQTGQVLARLDAAPQDNSVHSAQAALATAQAHNALVHHGFRAEDIQQAQERVNATQAALQEAKTQWARQSTLVPAGAAPQKALDTAQSVYDQAQANWKAAQAQLQLLQHGNRVEEVAESDAALMQARANLDSAKLAQNDVVLTAPSSGVILTRAIEPGAMVQVGSPAFSLSLTQPVWVRAYVPEVQLGQFPNGAKVELWTDSRPGQPYHGVVGFVSPTAEFTPKSVETTDLRTTLVYRIRIVVSDADPQLRQGMPVTVRQAL
jgi:HlyD family secretion protein